MTPPHHIKPNEGNRMPRHFVYLDCEAREVDTGDISRQTWRLAVTAYDGWNGHRGKPLPVEWRRHATPKSLWQYVTDIAPRRARTILVAHGIGYHLRIAQAMRYLPRMGWTLAQFGAHGGNVTLKWVREDKASLVFCDFRSWIDKHHEDIASLIGRQVPPLPATDDMESWYSRCEADVDILREACRQVWAFIEDGNLGNWQRTGAAMAWANWRHRHYTHRITTHDDKGREDAEKASTYTGRCEAWRHGRLPTGGYTEWDLPLAYCNVAASTRVPISARGYLRNPPCADYARNDPHTRVLYKATVSVQVPVLPYRDDTGIRWPLGRWQGWYWDIELATAALEGAEITLHSAYTYAARPALAHWAEWVTSVVNNRNKAWSGIERAVVKHWSRALIGKFAARYSEWSLEGSSPDDMVGILPIKDYGNDDVTNVMLLGDQCYSESDEHYGADTFPAIQAAIMAECRCRLWTLMRIAGLNHIVYVDTDSLITDTVGSANLRQALRTSSLWGLRPKITATSMTIYGPRHLVINGTYRLAGIPSAARYVGNDRMAGEVSSSMREDMSHGRLSSVTISRTEWHIKGIDRRREHVQGGETRTLRVP